MSLFRKIAIILFINFSLLLYSQTDTEKSDFVNDVYNEALSNGNSYEWLDYLSNEIGGRLSGSINAERAVNWGKEELSLISDSVWLQPVMVPKWVRGAPEYAHIESSPGNTIFVPIAALGGSISTPSIGIRANIIEVKSFNELDILGEEKIKGKIVFYNRPMEKTLIDTFRSYGGCVNQRYEGAVHASKYGAVGVIVRSMNLLLDDLPHTGSMTYDNVPVKDRIPSAAISTNDAELLSTMLKLDNNIKFYFKQNCKQFKDILSYNVIGELTGSEYPNEYILVGGHLDSWDLGDGSHDDGAGCVQSMDVIRLLKLSDINPKRTIRVVLFMNEENGTRGAMKYAQVVAEKKENHIFALESDAGGFSPRGFYFDSDDKNFNQILGWKELFKPYLIHFFERGGSGADVGPLKTSMNVLSGLKPDSQRYFDHHHSASDTFDAINKRELEMGAATITSLIYLIDKYGIVKKPKL